MLEFPPPFRCNICIDLHIESLSPHTQPKGWNRLWWKHPFLRNPHKSNKHTTFIASPFTQILDNLLDNLGKDLRITEQEIFLYRHTHISTMSHCVCQIYQSLPLPTLWQGCHQKEEEWPYHQHSPEEEYGRLPCWERPYQQQQHRLHWWLLEPSQEWRYLQMFSRPASVSISMPSLHTVGIILTSTGLMRWTKTRSRRGTMLLILFAADCRHFLYQYEVCSGDACQLLTIGNLWLNKSEKERRCLCPASWNVPRVDQWNVTVYTTGSDWHCPYHFSPSVWEALNSASGTSFFCIRWTARLSNVWLRMRHHMISIAVDEGSRTRKRCHYKFRFLQLPFSSSLPFFSLIAQHAQKELDQPHYTLVSVQHTIERRQCEKVLPHRPKSAHQSCRCIPQTME